jgi:hypothetical protein
VAEPKGLCAAYLEQGVALGSDGGFTRPSGPRVEAQPWIPREAPRSAPRGTAVGGVEGGVVPTSQQGFSTPRIQLLLSVRPAQGQGLPGRRHQRKLLGPEPPRAWSWPHKKSGVHSPLKVSRLHGGKLKSHGASPHGASFTKQALG